MKTEKVLNVIGRRPVGGIGAVVYNYQLHMDNSHVQMDYLLFDDYADGPFDEKVKALGSTVFVLPALRNMRYFTLKKKLTEFFKIHADKYIAVHLHSVNIGFLCFPLAKKYGIKHLISHSHATMYSDNKLKAIRNRILCLPIKSQANHWFACSKAAGEFLYGKKAVREGKVVIMNNAIDCEKFKYNEDVRNRVRKELSLENSFVIGHVGRFSPEKNHSFLIDIFAEVKKQKTNAKLLLIGEGFLIDKIRTKVNQLKLSDSILFLGQRNDVADLLQAMDVVVLPSIREGLPMLSIEAQSAGLPFICSDSLTKELKIVNTTYVSLMSSPDVWCHTIIECAPIDRKNTTKLICERNFDVKKEAQKLEEFYLNWR